MWNRFLKWLGFRKEWMIYSYDAARWIREGYPSSYCNYTIKYFPETHTATLEVKGKRAKEHSYYMQIILPRFYHFRNILLSYGKDEVVDYLKKTPIKAVVLDQPRGPEIEAQKSVAAGVKVTSDKETVENLEKKIQTLIKKEKYEKVAEVQAQLEEILKQGN